nr:MAG TPA: Thymidylate synthase complementing protein [Caudoviricetes sp.]
MDRIKVEILKCDTDLAEEFTFLGAVTRKSHKNNTIEAMKQEAHNLPASKVAEFLALPHSSLKRFCNITVAICGASRKFLQQIRTHHVGVSFMSGSTHYSDYSNATDKTPKDLFVVPYSVQTPQAISEYLFNCNYMYAWYKNLMRAGIPHSDAAYLLPEGLRNNLVMTMNLDAATKIIRERICGRNTTETRYIMYLLKDVISEKLGIDDSYFMPACYQQGCLEGKYCCGKKPSHDIKQEFPKLFTEETC